MHKLQLTGFFSAHFIQNTIVYAILKVLALDGLAIVCDIVSQMSTVLFLEKL